MFTARLPVSVWRWSSTANLCPAIGFVASGKHGVDSFALWTADNFLVLVKRIHGIERLLNRSMPATFSTDNFLAHLILLLRPRLAYHRLFRGFGTRGTSVVGLYWVSADASTLAKPPCLCGRVVRGQREYSNGDVEQAEPVRNPVLGP